MAHLDLHEQEQLDKIKYFWRDYGKYLIGLIVVIVIAYVSSLIWKSHNEKQSREASLVYANLTTAIGKSDIQQAVTLTEQLELKYPKTEYASLASMWLAKKVFAEGDLNSAIKYLSWTIKHTKDKGLIAISKVELANVYLDQKKYDQALKLMLKKTEKEFEPLFYAKRGDIYLVEGEKAKAREAYKEALTKAGDSASISQELHFKLDLLGDN